GGARIVESEVGSRGDAEQIGDRSRLQRQLIEQELLLAFGSVDRPKKSHENQRNPAPQEELRLEFHSIEHVSPGGRLKRRRRRRAELEAFESHSALSCVSVLKAEIRIP